MVKATIPQTSASVTIPALEIKRFELTLVGDTPLICNAWSNEARQEMLDRQMRKSHKPRAAKDPKKEFLNSLYVMANRKYGFPAVGFKAAAIASCGQLGLTKRVNDFRGSFHITPELIEIHGTPTMRTDMVRLPTGVADVRIRAEFKKWRAVVPIEYNENAISLEQLINMFNIGGFSCGIGNWRPPKKGIYGRFHVEAKKV